jgi:hypothetical protein
MNKYKNELRHVEKRVGPFWNRQTLVVLQILEYKRHAGPVWRDATIDDMPSNVGVSFNGNFLFIKNS